MSSNLAGLSLRGLQYAVAVDQARHFGRAAERCGVSQAALSEQLRKLEGVLGGSLFERGYRGSGPTARGAELLVQIERVLAEAGRLLAMARDPGDALAGRLRLGAIATLGPYYLPHLLRVSRAAFPELALLLTEGLTASLLEALRQANLDVVLLALPALGDGLVASALFCEPFRLVCPSGHALARLPVPRLRDLQGSRLLLLEEGHCLRDQALRLCGKTDKETRHATSLETLWHMIAAGEGVSLMPALSAAGREALDPLVTCRAMAEPEAARLIGLVWRATDPRGPAFQRLAQALRAELPAGVLAASV